MTKLYDYDGWIKISKELPDKVGTYLVRAEKTLPKDPMLGPNDPDVVINLYRELTFNGVSFDDDLPKDLKITHWAEISGELKKMYDKKISRVNNET